VVEERVAVVLDPTPKAPWAKGCGRPKVEEQDDKASQTDSRQEAEDLLYRQRDGAPHHIDERREGEGRILRTAEKNEGVDEDVTAAMNDKFPSESPKTRQQVCLPSPLLPPLSLARSLSVCLSVYLSIYLSFWLWRRGKGIYVYLHVLVPYPWSVRSRVEASKALAAAAEQSIKHSRASGLTGP